MFWVHRQRRTIQCASICCDCGGGIYKPKASPIDPPDFIPNLVIIVAEMMDQISSDLNNSIQLTTFEDINESQQWILENATNANKYIKHKLTGGYLSYDHSNGVVRCNAQKTEFEIEFRPSTGKSVIKVDGYDLYLDEDANSLNVIVTPTKVEWYIDHYLEIVYGLFI